MKKVLIIALLLICGIANAQNYLRINITEIQDYEFLGYCTTQYDSIVIEKETGCDWVYWHIINPLGQGFGYNTDEITILPIIGEYQIDYHSYCSIDERDFYIVFSEFQITEPWTQNYIWKRTGESVTLTGGGNGCNNQWSTGSTNYSITVTEPGTYWVRVYNDCGELYDTIQVRDNVEIELATCDLETNLNMITWPVTASQAEYVDHLIVKRDGVQVGTANYSDGYFLDEIGSDAASRTYTLKAVAPDGAQCSIVSYPKETIHMSYTLGMGNTVEVGWNTPTGYDLIGYNVCEWSSGSDLRVIDFVGAGVTSYTCLASQFDHGNIVVQGVEATKPETRLLSNRSWETVGVGELSENVFKVYPNPSNGIFTVEGVSNLTVYNTLGQVIGTSRSENGKHTFSLAAGIYFLKSDEGMARKVVVE